MRIRSFKFLVVFLTLLGLIFILLFKSAPTDSTLPSPTLINYQSFMLNQTEPDKIDTQCTSPFTRKQSLSIDVYLGYKDSRPSRYVGDRLESLILLSALKARCSSPDARACGFQSTKNNPFELIKTVNKKTYTVTIERSSLSLDDEFNRDHPKQRVLSENVQKKFLESLQESDVILYNGHSRDGGGPDFFPPRLSQDGHVDYFYYQKHTPGFKAMLESRPQDNPQILGLFSCASTKHFLTKLRAKWPKASIISSKALIYHADALINLYRSIELIMNDSCPEEWATKLRSKTAPVASEIYFSK